MTYRRYKRIDFRVRLMAIVGVILAFVVLPADWQIVAPVAVGLAVLLTVGRLIAAARLPHN
jgi:lipopolysaccharide export LptBFGC system permease protein LptF